MGCPTPATVSGQIYNKYPALTQTDDSAFALIRFADALIAARPDLPRETVYWRLHFALGMVHNNRFAEFDRREAPRLSAWVCMTEYDKTFGLPVAFPPQELTEIFPEIVARAGLKQLRCAETEKYAHVTFFFNGGRETVFANEDRILVPSPRDVKTYDQKPEMSAREVTDKVVEAVLSGKYGFILVNFANPDMVGHTGVLAASIKAVETVDAGVGAVVSAIRKQGGGALVTADHGNAERMVDSDGRTPFTAHTSDDVPLIANYFLQRFSQELGKPAGGFVERGGFGDPASPCKAALIECGQHWEPLAASVLTRSLAFGFQLVGAPVTASTAPASRSGSRCREDPARAFPGTRGSTATSSGHREPIALCEARRSERRLLCAACRPG